MSFKLMQVEANLGVQRRSTKMQFMLTGFKPDVSFRIFTFEASVANGPKLEFAVKVDLALARKYGIQLQALPLLCFALLERSDNVTQRMFTYSEDEMCLHARACKEERTAALLKKQSARKSLATSQPGVGWRTATPQPSNG
jgi:hypothetical protein